MRLFYPPVFFVKKQLFLLFRRAGGELLPKADIGAQSVGLGMGEAFADIRFAGLVQGAGGAVFDAEVAVDA